MTSKRRKLSNRGSCFLFRIEGDGSCRQLVEAIPKPLLVVVVSRERVCPRTKSVRVPQPSISHDSHDAISAELDDRLAARTEFQCKGLADRPPAD
jgi:hypothetical protein